MFRCCASVIAALRAHFDFYGWLVLSVRTRLFFRVVFLAHSCINHKHPHTHAYIHSNGVFRVTHTLIQQDLPSRPWSAKARTALQRRRHVCAHRSQTHLNHWPRCFCQQASAAQVRKLGEGMRCPNCVFRLRSSDSPGNHMWNDAKYGHTSHATHTSIRSIQIYTHERFTRKIHT